MQFSSKFSNTKNFSNSSFKTNKFKVVTKNVNFGNAMKSVNIDVLNFTNYLVKGSPLVKFVRKQYMDLENQRVDINDQKKYIPTIVNFNNPFLTFKLTTIIEKTRRIKVDKLPQIVYKYKCKENPEFQIYVANNTNNEYEVLAIDLYHLIIPAPDITKKETSEHSKEKYETFKLANYDLSEIKKMD